MVDASRPVRAALVASLAGGVVYFGSDDGALYAVSDEDAAGRPVPERAGLLRRARRRPPL